MKRRYSKKQQLLATIDRFLRKNFPQYPILCLSLDKIEDLLTTKDRVELNNITNKIINLEKVKVPCSKEEFNPCKVYIFVTVIQKLTANILNNELTDIKKIRKILDYLRKLILTGGDNGKIIPR